MKDPGTYQQKTGFPNDRTIDAKEVYRIVNSDMRDTKKYVRDVTVAVSKAILHYWEDDKMDQYHMRIPLCENYVFYIINKRGWLDSQGKYEICNPRRALERGIGVCTQSSMILVSLLNSKGITSKAIALKEHIFVTALVDKEKDEWWILDPDWGVVLEGDIEEVSKNFDLYKEGYEELIDSFSVSKASKTASLDTLKDIYQNLNYCDPKEFNMKLYMENNCRLERGAYLVKWLFPVLLLLSGLVLCFVSKKHV